MRKFINTIIFLAAAFVLTGYIIDANPQKFDSRTVNIYRNVKEDASKLYSTGVSAVQNLLTSYGLIKTNGQNPQPSDNPKKGINKDIVNKIQEKIQITTGMPEYKYTANNYEEYYKAIYAALNNFDDSVTIRLNNYNKDTYNLEAVNQVIYDHYDIDYGIKSIGGKLYSSNAYHAITITFEYGFDRETMLKMRASSDAKAKQIISEIIKPGMSDIQKELVIHDYIVKSTAYDYKNLERGTLPKEAFTTYGVLINGKAVCEGYAKAMFKLLNMAGVENKVVIGDAEGVPHAWNLVKINGSFTHLDATWDDPVTGTSRGILSHKYFNLSDQQIAKDHKWDTSKYPKAVSVPLK